MVFDWHEILTYSTLFSIFLHNTSSSCVTWLRKKPIELCKICFKKNCFRDKRKKEETNKSFPFCRIFVRIYGALIIGLLWKDFFLCDVLSNLSFISKWFKKNAFFIPFLLKFYFRCQVQHVHFFCFETWSNNNYWMGGLFVDCAALRFYKYVSLIDDPFYVFVENINNWQFITWANFALSRRS